MGKPSRSKRSASFTVGYKKPPTHTQFRPGQSGNPGGRRKGSASTMTRLRRALEETVVVSENGRKKRLSKGELALKQFANRAAKGDERALLTLLRIGLTREETVPPEHDVHGSRVFVYLPDNSRRRAPVDGLEEPMESVIDKVKRNDRILALLTDRERELFLRVISKLEGVLK